MSNLEENIRSAFESLFSSKLRTFLTTLGVGIGIAAVITLVSLGQAAQDYINRQFLSSGTNLVTIRPGAGFGPGFGAGGGGGPRRTSTSTLTDKDVSDLSDLNIVPNVTVVVPVVDVQAAASYGANSSTGQINGTTPAYFTMMNRTAASGRLFTDDDENTSARVAVIGQTTSDTLFGTGGNAIGETIAIRGVPFKVIGVLNKVGGTGAGSNQDSAIIVPLTAARAHLETERNTSGQYPVSEIYLEAANTDLVNTIVSTATAFLHTSHQIKSGDQNDFQVSSSLDLLESLTSTIQTLTIFLSVVGGISLLVGGIGVMNIMLVTVTERTREIGLRKAVGARGIDVLSQFLTEATVLCFVGGAAGLLLALAVTTILGQLIPSLQPTISVPSVALAVGVTSFIGIFFGLYPASRAASLSPIQALRSE